MTDRLCTKCRSIAKAERSVVRLTITCTNPSCGHREIKNIISKGGG